MIYVLRVGNNLWQKSEFPRYHLLGGAFLFRIVKERAIAEYRPYVIWLPAGFNTSLRSENVSSPLQEGVVCLPPILIYRVFEVNVISHEGKLM